MVQFSRVAETMHFHLLLLCLKTSHSIKIVFWLTLCVCFKDPLHRSCWKNLHSTVDVHLGAADHELCRLKNVDLAGDLVLSQLFVCLVFNGTFSTNRLYCAIEVRSTSRMARGQYKNFMQIKQRKNTINQDNQTLFGLGFMEMIPSPRLGFLREVFLANHLASNDNLTRTTKRQNAYQLSLRF